MAYLKSLEAVGLGKRFIEKEHSRDRRNRVDVPTSEMVIDSLKNNAWKLI